MLLTLTKHMDVMLYQFRWSSYAVDLLLNPCLLSSRTKLILVHFQISRADQIPVHKKGDKQIINNYRLVSLLSFL